MIGVQALAAVSGFFLVMFFFYWPSPSAWAAAPGADRPAQVRRTARRHAPWRVPPSRWWCCSACSWRCSAAPLRSRCCTRWALADILPDATRYARIILIAMPGLFVFLLSTAMLRGVGDTVTPLFTLLISTAAWVLTPALVRHGAACRRGRRRLCHRGGLRRRHAGGWAGTWRGGARRVHWHRTPISCGTCASAAPAQGHPQGGRAHGGTEMIVVALAELVLLGLVNGFGSMATVTTAW